MKKTISPELWEFVVALRQFNRSNLLEKLPLLHELLNRHYQAKPEVDIERARFMTRYFSEAERVPASRREPMPIRRAKAVASYLAGRSIVFHDNNLLGGATTSKEVGAAVYPELFGISIWPELDSISTRPENPLILSEEDANALNLEIFPWWMERTVTEQVRNIDPARQSWLEKLVLFSVSKAVTLSHTTPCYRLALEKGIDGLIAEARAKETATNDPEKRIFYQSMQHAMKGVIRYAQRVSEEAKKRSQKETDTRRAASLRAIAEVTAKVPAAPATTYHEALNTIALCQAAVLAENVNMAMNPGRLDQLLYPYFIREWKAGTLSIEDALTLTGCLWFKLADNVNLVPEASERLFGGAGSVPAITLGGVDEEGRDAVNELTFLMLKVVELLPIRDPNVNARFHPIENPVAYRDEVARTILSTGAIPAMYNDIENIAALQRQLGDGPLQLAHARDYAIIGCVELGSQGRDFSASSSIFMMMHTVLYMALHDGKTPVTGAKRIGVASGDPATYTSFDDVWNAYVAQTRWMADNTVALNNTYGKMHQKLLPTPLLSCFFEGPMDTGQDVVLGGARYNSSGVTHIGFADVCDSLNAIWDVCFNPQNTLMQVSLPEFIKAVDANFAGYERLLTYIKTHAPKFGSSNPIAQSTAQRLVTLEYETFNSKQNYRGGNYRVAYWTMTNHAGYGFVSGALPNGRLAGRQYSSGITPVSQIDTQLTTALNAVAGLDSQQIPGAYALNIKLGPVAASDDNAARLGGVVEGFMQNGGQQVQFTVRDYDTLKKAKQDPDAYPHMVVRVSGYSAYFDQLNSVMQDELIERSLYRLASGELVKID